MVLVKELRPTDRVGIVTYGNDAQVRLQPLSILRSGDFKQRDLNRILKVAEAHQQLLKDAWNEYNPDNPIE